MRTPGSFSRSLRDGLAVLILATVMVLASVRTAIAASGRVALVIGNNAYATAPLDNPIKDAKAIAGALKRLGFDVIEINNANKSQIETAIAEFREALRVGAGVGLVYYAGHAVQLNFRNYLVPIDATLGRAQDVGAQTVDVQLVLDAFKHAANRMNIVVLDACRDNPFGATGRGVGLAPLDAPWGTFLAYSTAPGNVAEDGLAETGNSVYTHYLVQELARPQSRIEDVFKRVRLQVRQRTQGRQIPWESTSLEEEFYFDRLAIEKPAKLSETARDQQFALERTDWERIAESKRADDFYDFLTKYPNGTISELAQARIERLAASRLVAMPDAKGVTTNRRPNPDYRVGDRLVYDVYDLHERPTKPRHLRFTRVSSDRIELNGGHEVWDELGNLIKNDTTIRTPAKVMIPAEIYVGKKWRSSFSVGSNTVSWDFQVASLEDVVVPAGKYRAYRVEGSSTDSWAVHQTQKYWIDSSTFIIIKDIFRRPSRYAGRIDDGFRRELREFKRAPGI